MQQSVGLGFREKTGLSGDDGEEGEKEKSRSDGITMASEVACNRLGIN